MNENHSELLKSTLIWQTLNELSEEYSNRALAFVEGVEPILNTISTYFPYYTRHDALHSYNILNRYENVLKAECFVSNNDFSLTQTELYLLICSAYSHDLGMTVFPEEVDSLRSFLRIKNTSEWETNEKLQDYLRKNHSERGYKYIVEHAEMLQIPTNYLSYLNSLSRAHNLSTYDLKLDILNKYSADSKQLPLTQLACILCVADALEFSDTRVNDSVLLQLQNKITTNDSQAILISYRENMKHVCIGSNLAVSENGEMIVNGTFKDAEVLNLAHKTIDDVEQWLRGYLEIDNTFSHPRLRIRNHLFYRKLEFPFGDFERLGVRLKKENVINLISSNAVWNNKGEKVIKELLQNAVEACRFRRHHSSTADAYEPQINLKFDYEKRLITLSDNGCGMSKDVVLENFLTVGNSRSFSSDYNKNGYVSLARFGIGFWSVFTICDIAHIQTKDVFDEGDSGLEFNVSINQLKDYLLFSTTQRLAGTTIVLSIKQEVNIQGIYSRLYNEIICSDVPITIESTDVTYTLPLTPVCPSIEDVFGPKIDYAFEHNTQIFYFDSELADYSFRMYITYRFENDKASFLIDDIHRKSLHSLHSSIVLHSIHALCGFTVYPGSVFIPIQFNAVGGYIANIKNPKGYSFNINRTSLLQSNELARYLDMLSDFLLQGYDEFLKKTNSTHTEDVYRLRRESQVGVSGGIGNDAGQIINAIKKYPKQFAYRLFKIERGRNINNCEIEYIDIDNLLKLDYNLVAVKPYFNYMDSTRVDEENSLTMYNTLQSLENYDGYYYIEAKSQFDIFFDYDPNSYVVSHKFISNNEVIRFPLLICNPKNVSFNYQNDSRVGYLQGIGKWTGAVYIKNVKGANFCFANNSIYINPNTVLAEEVVKLYKNGELIRLTDLLNHLAFSESGHTIEAVKKYL